MIAIMLEKVKDAPRNLVTFYGDVKSELKKVTWPSKREVYATTFIVIITVFFFGVYLFVVDLFLQNLVQQIFGYFQ